MGLKATVSSPSAANEPEQGSFLKNTFDDLSLQQISEVKKQESEVQKQIRKIEAGEQTFEGMFSTICKNDQTPCQEFVRTALKIEQKSYKQTKCNWYHFQNLLVYFAEDYHATLSKEQADLTTDTLFMSDDSLKNRWDQVDFDRLLAFIVEKIAWPHIKSVTGKSKPNMTGKRVPFDVIAWYSRYTDETYQEGVGTNARIRDDLIPWYRSFPKSTQGMGRKDFVKPNGGKVPVPIDGTARTFHKVSKYQFDMPNVPACSSSDYKTWSKICLAEYVIDHEFDEKDNPWRLDYSNWLDRQIRKQTLFSKQNETKFYDPANRLQELLKARQKFDDFCKAAGDDLDYDLDEESSSDDEDDSD